MPEETGIYKLGRLVRRLCPSIAAIRSNAFARAQKQTRKQQEIKWDKEPLSSPSLSLLRSTLFNLQREV